MFKKILSSILFLSFSVLSISQNVNSSKLDSLFDVLNSNNKFMGSICIFKNSKQVYNRFAGYSSKITDKKILNDSTSKYQIGSITKMFTATIIFQLIDENKITLDTKLSSYFPEIHNANKITIKTLLGHKSGLYDFVNDIENDKYLVLKREKKELLKLIVKSKPHFKPNENFSYSNSGYLLLSFIIEKITKLNYKDAVEERICKKINLLNTYSCASGEIQNVIAIPYSYNGKWNEINDFCFNNVIGVGDIVSTTADLITFNEAMLHGKLFSMKSLAKMKLKSGSQFCLGIMQIPFASKIAYGHGGDTYGTHSIVSTFEKDSLSIACISNGLVMELNDISYAVAQICFNEKYEIPTFSNYGLKSEDLDKYVGIYLSPTFPLNINITKDNIILYAQATGQSQFALEALSKDIFEYKSAGINLEFIPTKSQMILKQAGKKFILTKK